MSLAPDSANHHTILLLPPSSPDIRIAKKATKTNKKWNEEGCFPGMSGIKRLEQFLSPSDDTDDQVDVVFSNINFCEEIITSKIVTIFPNNKTWVTKEIININTRNGSSSLCLRDGKKRPMKQNTIRINKLKYKNSLEWNLLRGNFTRPCKV